MTTPVEVTWSAPLPPDAVAGLLTPAEQDRLAGLRVATDRARFATGRALLRLVVAQHTGQPVADVAFDVRCRTCGRPHGKPRHDPGPGVPAVPTSVSHAGPWVLVAVAAVPVGVDVDACAATRFDGFDLIALTAAERRELGRRPDSERAAARTDLWTQKEALLKLHEIGLRTEPSELHLGLSASDRVVNDPLRSGSRVAFARVRVDPDHRAWVAVAGDTPPVVRLFTGRRLLEAAAATPGSATG